MSRLSRSDNSVGGLSILPSSLLLVALLLSGCRAAQLSDGASSASETVRVGLIPNQSPDTVKAQYEPFREYLSEQLDLPVELFVASDYAGVVEAMASDRLDLAYFGGLTFVQAEQRARIRPVVTEVDQGTHTTKYHSVIITQANSDIRQVKDIKGKLFAFGDINSTSGSLYPRLMLEKAGITDFESPELFIYSGGHDATALAVQNGTVAAAGLEERILHRQIDRGTIDPDTIRIVERSDPIEGYPWVVRESLDQKMVQKITSAFLSMQDKQLLELMRAERYERVDASDYDYIREQAMRLGLVRKEE